MPELPEVQTVLNGVVEALKGLKINDLQCFYPGTVVRDPELDPVSFPAELVSHERRGKYMILHLSGGSSLIIHLRMTGKLVSGKHGDDTGKHERACFLLSRGQKLHFVDIRTFGKIVHCRTENIGKFMPKLGVEPLSRDFTPQYLLKLTTLRKAPVKSILLDQSLIAGLGNIYACEVLYRARLHPALPAYTVTLAKAKRMVKETKAVLTEAIAMNGTSISDFRRVDDKTGEFQNFLQIYQKDSCPQGHPVKRIVQGGRSTFYCPVCQK